MKHLRKFNESKFSLREDLQEFCDTYLAYLYDEGFKIDLNDLPNSWEPDFHATGSMTKLIRITKPSPDMGYRVNFYWKDIEDNFIPFIEVLQQKYYLRTNIEFITPTNQIMFKPMEIINELGDLNYTFKMGIKEILIYVTGKK